MARRNDTNEEDLKKPLNKQRVQKSLRIFKYIKPYRNQFIIGLICLAFTAGTALTFPFLLSKLINASGVGTTPPPSGMALMQGDETVNISKDELLKNINSVGIWLLLLFFAQAIFSFFRIMLFVNVTEKALADVRKATYSKLIQMPMGFFSSRRVGELTSRLSADITQLQDTFTTTIAEFLRQLIIIIGGIIALSIFSIELCLVMLCTIPLLAVITVFFGRFIRRVSKQVQDKVAESATIVEETLQGIASVKAYVNEGLEILRYNKNTDAVATLAIKGGKYRGLFASFIIIGLFGGIVFIIWWASRMLAKGQLTPGEMIGFMFITIMVGASFGGIAELYAQIQKALGATERIMDILDEETETIDLGYNKETGLQLQGKIEFNNVHFTYPSRPDYSVLNGISFTAEQGQRVAIVGPSGAGKSTVIQLLQRFYAPLSGTLYFDEKDAQSYDLSALRSNIAIVPQDVILFGGSIKENIGYGKPGATDEEIMEAAKKANAHSFIIGFPEQYDTLVGDRGIQLSGGQRQRIAIARAVLKNPAILLLDEATSSLDSESEKLVQEALDKLMQGRTSVIIAHRLSTIRDADRILVVEKGKIVESGTHDELIKNTEGLYYGLSKLQFEFADSEHQ